MAVAVGVAVALAVAVAVAMAVTMALAVAVVFCFVFGATICTCQENYCSPACMILFCCIQCFQAVFFATLPP